MPYYPSHLLLEILCWVCLISILIPYFLYPPFIWFCSLFSKGRAAPVVEASQWPDLTVVVAAYNAEKVIEQRIRNIQDSDYPSDKWRMVIVSDGSTDSTVQRARALGDPRVDIVVMNERSGKARALERALREVRSGIVVFTDVTAKFLPNTLRHLGRHFIDEDVGLVSGELQVVDGRGIHVEGVYWQIEAATRRAEARLGILTGASGAVYAMRRKHYVPTSRPTINDDMVLPLLASAQSGCRFVQDPSAIAQIAAVKSKGTDLRRRRRISRGIWQSLPLLLPAFLKIGAGTFLAFVAHKLLRWLCPLFMIGFLLTSILLSSLSMYRVLAIIQLGFYSVAALGFVLSSLASKSSSSQPLLGRSIAAIETSPLGMFLHLSSAFVTMNFGVLSGFFQWLYEPTKVIWDPSERPVLVNSLKSPEGNLS